ncbi:MAG: hypothetical protein MK085_11360 [Phycisphaerales bacterium]|nr:hypothetical protein [Phycisphaerales bacterium]
MADLPTLQPDDKDFEPGKESPDFGIPNLQPEVTEERPKYFYTWDAEDYPASALPVIARRDAMPGNAGPGLVSLFILIPIVTWILINVNWLGCSIPLSLVLIAAFAIAPLKSYSFGPLATRWAEWSMRHKDFICLDCGEPLNNQPESGSCPACTQPYSRESCQWGWQRWRQKEGLEAEPPARPGPVHASKPCPSILSGSPGPYRLLLLIESQSIVFAMLGFWIGSALTRSAFGSWNPMFSMATVLLILAALCWLFTLTMRRGKTRSLAANDRLCSSCSYQLDGDEPCGTCSECGFYYTLANCQWAWRRLRKDKNIPPTPPPRLIPPGNETTQST